MNETYDEVKSTEMGESLVEWTKEEKEEEEDEEEEEEIGRASCRERV